MDTTTKQKSKGPGLGCVALVWFVFFVVPVCGFLSFIAVFNVQSVRNDAVRSAVLTTVTEKLTRRQTQYVDVFLVGVTHTDGTFEVLENQNASYLGKYDSDRIQLVLEEGLKYCMILSGAKDFFLLGDPRPVPRNILAVFPVSAETPDHEVDCTQYLNN